MTLIFGFFGAFIGGMLGMSPATSSTRRCRCASAACSERRWAALGFTFIYHFIAKKALWA
jgi:hypothetical protein